MRESAPWYRRSITSGRDLFAACIVIVAMAAALFLVGFYAGRATL